MSRFIAARPASFAAGLLLTCLMACGGGMTPKPFLMPTPLTDINPDPNIVEVQLVAGPSTIQYLPGSRAQVWAYRDGAVAGSVGTVPGPMLLAKQGDRVIVHLRNELPEPTTIHWHGLRLPASQDGSAAVQTAIQPGGVFTYNFTVLDAGTFWFHPHLSGDVQIEKGLYAPIVVTGSEAIDVAADRYLVLDDVKLRADGQMEDQTNPLDIMMGRQGNVVVVNGQKGATLFVATGTRERWRLLNAANGRYFNLSLPGHSFLVIGWDGGLLPRPYSTDKLLIAPGERYEVLVTFDHPQLELLSLQTLYYDRGHDIPDPGPQDLFKVAYDSTGPAPTPPMALPSSLRTLSRLDATGTPVRIFALEEHENPTGTLFSINGEEFPKVSPLAAKQGDLEVWEIQGNPEMDHPFHLHGNFFQVLSVDGVPPVNFGLKDTVNVPKGSKLRFAVRHETLGMWMYHCHILEHAERGMMGMLMIE